MEQAQENSVEKEVATPEAEVQETPQEQAPQPQVDDRQERNWRQVRQRLTDLERENKEKDELLKRALSLQQVQTPQVQEEIEEPDEEYISKGKVKRLAKKEVEPLQKRIDDLEAKLAQQKQIELIQGLRSRYPDFDEIVNPETIALFEEKDPELANTIAELKDPYKIGMQSYKYIKALGLKEEVPGNRRQKEAEKKLEKNAKTVQSPQAFDKRPMAQAFRLTETEKSKLWDEMQQYGSMASSVPSLQ